MYPMHLIVHVEHSSAFLRSIRPLPRFFIAKQHAVLAFALTVFIHRCEYLPTQNTFVGICRSPSFRQHARRLCPCRTSPSTTRRHNDACKDYRCSSAFAHFAFCQPDVRTGRSERHDSWNRNRQLGRRSRGCQCRCHQYRRMSQATRKQPRRATSRFHSSRPAPIPSPCRRLDSRNPLRILFRS